MTENAIREYAKSRGFHPQTLDRWLHWEPADQAALQQIAVSLKISENHLRDMMDWLEEISLRDRSKIHELLANQAVFSIATDPRIGRADKLKRIKEQLRRWRFPRLAAVEDLLRMKIQALKLPGEIHLSVAAGLEGGLQVKLSAGNQAQLEQLTHVLANAAASASIAELFTVLSGHSGENDRS